VLCDQDSDDEEEEQWQQIKKFASGFQEGQWKL